MACGDERPAEYFNFEAFLQRQKTFSTRAFGPDPRPKGIIAHIVKELIEIERNPTDLEEWIDVVLLGLDGAWRSGHSPEEIMAMLDKKLTTNENRNWPDYRTLSVDEAIEHVR